MLGRNIAFPALVRWVALPIALTAAPPLWGCSTQKPAAHGATAESSAGGEDAPKGETAGKGLSYGADAKKLFDRAMGAFNTGGCEYAKIDFNEVRRKFPYSRYAALSELRIADCDLRENEHLLAIQGYRRFIRQRPSHEEIPYARFQVVKAYATQIPPDIFFMPPAHEIDPKPARETLREGRRFVTDFPKDERLEEAQKMVARSLEVLAGHEIYAARYYYRRGAHQGVVTRITTLQLTYPDHPFQGEALLLLGQSYVELKDKPKAREALTQLVERFPESKEAAKARGLLDKLGRGVESKAAESKAAEGSSTP